MFIHLLISLLPLTLILVLLIFSFIMTEISITAKTTKGQTYSVTISDESTISDLKKALESPSETPADQQRLIYSGHVLKDDKTIKDYGTFLSPFISSD